MENEDREVRGFCAYCKDEIFEDDAHVVEGKNKYHMSCYQLLTEDIR